jgi:hypothetical protein
MRRFLLSALLVLLVSPALSQSDWMNAGKNALQSVSGSAGGGSSQSGGLSNDEIASGLKEALRVGTEKAVETVGRPGGFMNDRNVHISLPGPLEKIKAGLVVVGASGMAEDLEQRINKAAESAAPKAASIFGGAVSRMSIEDARAILTGPRDSATQYFKRTTSPQLKQAMRPIVDQALSKVGAVESYNALVSKAQEVPFASGLNLDLSDYVVSKALDGIFFYVAGEEAEIRTDPAARTTDLLKTVFK